MRALLRHRLSAREAESVDSLPVVSNWLHFEGGRVSGFSQPLLHMFNKNGAFATAQLGEARWGALAAGRRVCLLLGDGLGDATSARVAPGRTRPAGAAFDRERRSRAPSPAARAVADGLDLPVVLKIGFLNEVDPERVAARLPAYERAFDAVVLGDTSFSWVLAQLPSE